MRGKVYRGGVETATVGVRGEFCNRCERTGDDSPDHRLDQREAFPQRKHTHGRPAVESERRATAYAAALHEITRLLSAYCSPVQATTPGSGVAAYAGSVRPVLEPT